MPIIIIISSLFPLFRTPLGVFSGGFELATILGFHEDFESTRDLMREELLVAIADILELVLSGEHPRGIVLAVQDKFQKLCHVLVTIIR